MDNFKGLLSDVKLQFNIEHPSFEECYAFGYECALAEIEETENPFRTGTKESEQWLEGWWAGFYGETPIYDLADYMSSSVDSVKKAANDEAYHEQLKYMFFAKVLEITGVIAVSALVGYQVIDLVA
ncbi:transmission trait enhancer LetE [Legionella nagasakiensis]|uniref:transmission trait enhancer LetE n=1 Tax=Legionella nagasakiensis TaxID=535290 RepID=UPI00105647D2|nr:transmission trait enhancer LetE [Legionella nagasakiensis]